MTSSPRRIRWLVIVLWVGLAVIAGRLFQIQILEHDAWVQEGALSRLRVRSLPFRRGAILDRHGKVLARDATAYGLGFHYDAFRSGSLAGQVVEAVEVLGAERVDVASVLRDPAPALAILAAIPARGRDAPREGSGAPGASSRAGGREEGGRASREASIEGPSALVRRDVRGRVGRALPTILSSREGRRGSLTAFLEAVESAPGGATLGTCFPQGFVALRERIEEEGADLARLSKELQEEEDKLLEDLDGVHEGIEERVAAARDEDADGRRDLGGLRRRYEGILRSFRVPVPYEAALHVALNPDRYPGFVVQEHVERVYPLGEARFAPHVIGIVGPPTAEEVARYHEARRELLAYQKGLLRAEDEGERIQRLTEEVREIAPREGERRGRTGVEAAYESWLRGRRGWVKALRDGAVLERRLPRAGRDIHLTIDAELQLEAEHALDEVAPEGAGGVCLLDVDTGEVLALASRPRFRPEDYRQRYTWLASAASGHALHPRTHRPFFPPAPGSVLKPFVAVAALEEGILTPATTIRCEGVLRGLHCEGVHGDIAVHDALRLSCNVFFAEVARRMGYEALWTWMRRFGFGEKTGLGLGEIEGDLISHVPPLQGLLRFGIGQQVITVTPVQVARAMAAIAGPGILRPVRIVRDVAGAQELLRERSLDVSPGVLAVVRDALAAVTARGGTAGPRPGDTLDLRELGGGVAGKTGTPETWQGGGEDHAWFAGYFPAASPRIAFAVFLENAGEHGRYAAHVLEKILRGPVGSRWKAWLDTAEDTGEREP